MTCIVGIEVADGVLLGADSRLTSGWTTGHLRPQKLFRVGGYVFGHSGDMRSADLLRHRLELKPAKLGPMSAERHVVTVIVPAIRAALKEGGTATQKEGADGYGGEVLVGVDGALFGVQCDFSVGRAAHGYLATGSGREVALGALAVTAGMAPRRRLRLALEAAALHNAGVSAPFQIMMGRKTI